ncbi:MAG: DUF2157 domain-containing protein [Mycobacterium leprae]
MADSREFRSLIPDESARWVNEGLISETQRQAILKLYPPAESGRDRTIIIFSILGSLLVGAGVILFFAANWPKIDAWVKLATIIVAVVGTYGAGYYLQYKRQSYPLLGQALMLLGSLFYGSGIWLVAQMFHLQAHYPTGFLAWGLGILPLVAAVGSAPVLYLASVVLGVWTVTSQAPFREYNWLYPVLLLGAILPLGRRLKAGLAEAGVLVGLFLWFVINASVHTQISYWYHGLALVGRLMLLYGVAVVLAGLARLKDPEGLTQRPYLAVGSFLALLGSFLLTIPRGYGSTTVPLPALFSYSAYATVGVVLLLAGAVLCGWLYWRRVEPGRTYVLPAMALLLIIGLFGHLPGDKAQLVLFNLTLFGSTVGLIALGVSWRNNWLVNMGLLAFVVHVLTRYFDLFFTAMNRSLFFVVGGILLLGGGWLLERNRRRWTNQTGGERHDH